MSEIRRSDHDRALAGIIDERLLARLVLVPHDEALGLAPSR
jgi:hypothetical protein